jgi:hypothetical protein
VAAIARTLAAVKDTTTTISSFLQLQDYTQHF